MTGAPPLDGVKVVEFGQLIGAPVAAMILAELGAEVVKIEPFGGDAGRELQTAAFAGSGTSPTFLAFNRSKRSVALDLKREEAREVAWRLIADADVVVSSSRPGAMERLGLGAEQVHERYPGVIHASISGFGEAGPERDRRGVDMVIQAESGIMSVTGDRGGAPLKVGFTVVDVAAGNVLAQAVLASLVRRAGTGEGDSIHVSLLEVAMHLQAAPLSEYLATGQVPERWGNAAPMTAPADLMETKDGYLVVSAYLEDHWRRFCELLELPELVDDPRFATKVARVANRDALMSTLETSMKLRTSDEWLSLLHAAGILVGEVRDYSQVVTAPQVEALETIIEVPLGPASTFRTPRLPARFGSWTPRPPGAPPEVGEHTTAVLGELGYGADEIARLDESGATRAAPTDGVNTDTDQGTTDQATTDQATKENT